MRLRVEEQALLVGYNIPAFNIEATTHIITLIGMEILGFDNESKIVGTTVPGRKLTWEEIGNRSVRSLVIYQCT